MNSPMTDVTESASISAEVASQNVGRFLTKIKTNRVVRATVLGLGCYAITSLIAILGVIFGYRFLEPPIDSHFHKRNLIQAFANQDGGWYRQIVTTGYSYNPEARSPVAFFPLYPLLSHCVMRSFDLWPEAAMLIVAHVCLALAFVLGSIYVEFRQPGYHSGAPHLVLLTMGLMPATFFFRMTYAESLFLFLSILSLLGMARRWPLLVIGLIVGLATATRPVGVSLVAPFLLHCWHRAATPREFLLKVSLLLPVACWGIGAYAIYLQLRFGDPLAFAKTQENWGSPVPLPDKIIDLLSYHPIWSIFDHEPLTGLDEPPNALDRFFSWRIANSACFALTAILIVIGAMKRWLSSYEILLAVFLLLIPYYTRAIEMGMSSQARFAGVVFPVYLVLGNLLARLPWPVSGSILGLSAFYMGIFAAMFASWHWVF